MSDALLNVFHISDLHFTASKSGTVRDAAYAATKSILRLAETLKQEGALTPNLCVFITGDLVQSGAKTNSEEANDFEAVQTEFLEPLLKILEVGPERVFITPGNHELDRDAVDTTDKITTANFTTKRTCEADIHNDLQRKLDSFFEFVQKFGYQSVTRDSPRLSIFQLGKQSIACLNGLVGSYSGRGSSDKGELFILPSEYGGTLASIPEFSAVLLHHPLSWFDDKCEADLKELFGSKRVRLFTGHIHDKGLHWLETSKGSFALAQAGVSAEYGDRNEVAVAWLPHSESIAVRHFAFDKRTGEFNITPATETKVAPQKAASFFQRTEVYFDRSILNSARQMAADECKNELLLSFNRPIENYVPPDVVLYAEDQYSGRRTKLETLQLDANHRVISGDELSGKTSFIAYNAYSCNAADSANINVVIDFRALLSGREVGELVLKKLTAYGLNRAQASFIVEQGFVEVWIDNFDANQTSTTTKLFAYLFEHPKVRWTISAVAGQSFTPSNTAIGFPATGVSYYGLSEVTLPTVLRMIENHEYGKGIENPRSVVEQVFRSINNLRAPRTVFYVDSLVDMFLSDASVEPLNRYLLIENLLSERVREAHKKCIPNQAVDMEMIETFIGQIAHHLLTNKKQFLSKADYYSLAEQFIERKGLQPKRFNSEKILEVLLGSFVFREYDGEYCFIMLSVEDYYLAKHMGHDASFRSSIMSTQGLLQFPTVAEYYIAQNPSDRDRIQQIFDVLAEFESEIWPLIEEFDGATIQAIKQARPGTPTLIEEEILDKLSDVESARDGAVVVSNSPSALGKTKRLVFSPEERGAVFLQLGASILGVTRTLDQEERVRIFQKLRRLLLICVNGVPVVAQHLANGGEVRLRGITVRADYVGALAKQDDRFYIILRSMLYNVFKRFGTWSGSPSFFNAAVKLRNSEDDELVCAALLAQNIEADLSEALDFIQAFGTKIESPILKEIVIRLYLDAMTLVPLPLKEEQRAIDLLTNATIEIDPPKNAKSDLLLEQHKTKVRQEFADRVGLSAYVGKLLRRK